MVKATFVIVVLDSLRDPRDMASAIHFAIATETPLVITGNSIDVRHYKVTNIIASWFPAYVTKSEYYLEKYVSSTPDYFACIAALKKKKYALVGTTPMQGSNLYATQFTKEKIAVVFGTESSGLSTDKMEVLDSIVSVPMHNGTAFFTISAILPAIVLEVLRQKRT